MTLKFYGFDIIGIAKNGTEAIDMYKQFSVKPDIIILDNKMPGKNGIEIIKDILDINKNAKIVFATADRNTKKHAKELGITCSKEKPFSNQRLIDNIKKASSNQDSG